MDHGITANSSWKLPNTIRDGAKYEYGSMFRRFWTTRQIASDRIWTIFAHGQRGAAPLIGNREIDTRFWVGLFDFPMIDNTHLTHGERCAVPLTELTPSALNVALAYFPGSRASLKDKPYYDDVMHDLLNEKHLSGHHEN